MSDDENDEDEKLHNSEGELHNSNETPDADDYQPEEQTEESTYVVDVGDLTPTYYRRDEEGELHSYEFLPEELIHPDGFFWALRLDSFVITSFGGRHRSVAIRLRKCYSRSAARVLWHSTAP